MVELRRRGVPGVVICSEPFVTLARSQAKNLGDAGVPLAVITHPLGGLEPAEVAARAAQAVPHVLAALKGDRS